MALERREDWQTDTEREGGREQANGEGGGNIPLAKERCGVVMIAFVSDIGPFSLTH
jgi:hypothetical protein